MPRLRTIGNTLAILILFSALLTSALPVASAPATPARRSPTFTPDEP